MHRFYPMGRRLRLQAAWHWLGGVLAGVALCRAESPPPAAIELPLDAASAPLVIEGPHRFRTVAGITGLQVTSLHTQAYFETPLLLEPRGSISVWMSPLESIGKARSVGLPLGPQGNYNLTFPLLSDHFPACESEACRFSLFYRADGAPNLMARFTDGNFWDRMDVGIGPFAYPDFLALEKGQWYHIVVTWDKPAGVLNVYLNGERVGYNHRATGFAEPGRRLFLGNPLMVLSHLRIAPEVPEAEDVRRAYRALRPAGNEPSEAFARALVVPVDRPDLDVQRDATWEKVYECSFTKPGDLQAWIFQTGDKYRDLFKLEISEEGLLWQTPDIVDKESRGYLWSPVNVDGDQWIEFDFQVLSPRGLGLVMFCASGFQGEDYPADHELDNSGSMRAMLNSYRSYHWEYMRRVEAMPTHVESQSFNKQPWSHSLFSGCIPRLEQDRWHRLRFVKIGGRLHGSIDGRTVFDVCDDAQTNNGPILDSGRIILREMYHTTMRYRNFVVFRKMDSRDTKQQH